MNKYKKHRYVIDGITFYAYNYSQALEIYRAQTKR